ncbi:MAG TPA: signal peptidase II [Fimbriimonadaceae bacterium]|nr:signal peptidase II [Fimbriimonadaceae bacterium]
MIGDDPKEAPAPVPAPPPIEVAKPRIGPGFYIVVAVLLLALDQIVKAWARGALVPGEKIAVPWPGVFEITLTYNHGIAFGLFQGAGILFAPIALGITVGTTWYVFRHPHEARLTHFAMGMLASGAIGNLIDRVWLGKVTDMFWLRIIDFPVFNIADACITVSAVLLGIRWIFEHKPHGRRATPPEPGS